MTSLRRVTLLAIPLLLFAALPAADDEPSPDEKAIQDAAVKFVDAYNDQDVAAMAALFDPQGRIEEADGTIVQGGEAIRAAFAAAFEAEPAAQISLEMDSLTMLTPEIAVEQGATDFFPDGETMTSRGRYLVVHQKKDGAWRMISARSLEKEVVSNFEYLRQLAWLSGDWIDEDANETVETTFHWDDDRNFLLSEFQVKRGAELLGKGTQRLGWDPQRKEIRGWIFDSRGGFAESRWVDVGDRWTVTINGVNSAGATQSEIRTLVPGIDRVEVGIMNRVVGGESLPDLQFMMVRRPPAPASKATAQTAR
ncbi:SnoaL-like domain protein [Caulifigura coniformis]|uniref:SnoaL-like domain protein n=1 Tax=Caulifigura coniformis TaxID=2527983 RepID=A0A517SIH5_9PLAN|nr:SgcJ/EcaC family oxidoreductase [Caulifigura coniformis]QDT55921.1 SnoaL-like domain protein [Caulifigura coniformis]